MFNILIAKAATSVAVDYDNLPEVSKTYFLEYGMRQALNDATASLKLADFETPELFKAAALAMVEKKLDGIQKGELRQSVGKIGDPIEAEVMRIATATIANAILAKNGKLKDYTTKDMRERAVAMLEKYPAKAEAIRAEATANIAKKAALAEGIEIDL